MRSQGFPRSRSCRRQCPETMKIVLRHALPLVLIRLALGIPAAMAGARRVSSERFGISAADPGAIGLATLILLAVAAAASYLPARRASRVDPLVALREE